MEIFVHIIDMGHDLNWIQWTSFLSLSLSNMTFGFVDSFDI